jgi:SAM-dependent methyltransferase
MKESFKTLLKKAGWYHPLQSSYRNFLSWSSRLKYRFTYRKYKGSGFVCNFCGASYRKFVPEYPSADIKEAIISNKVIAGYGENVFCPNCMSKNRERLVKAVMGHYLDIRGKKILHFSPEKNLYRYLKTQCEVITVDISPGFYKTTDPAITYADATGLHFEDKSFGIVVANHILEHIPDDLKAMSEIYRVLKNGGVAILQAPWSEALPATIEEPFITDPQKQAKLYGQKDHVRIYTLNDYIKRLHSVGFDIKLIPCDSLKQFRIHAIQEREPAVLAYKP